MLGRGPQFLAPSVLNSAEELRLLVVSIAARFNSPSGKLDVVTALRASSFRRDGAYGSRQDWDLLT
jgi:hypothetical protein